MEWYDYGLAIFALPESTDSLEQDPRAAVAVWSEELRREYEECTLPQRLWRKKTQRHISTWKAFNIKANIPDHVGRW